MEFTFKPTKEDILYKTGDEDNQENQTQIGQIFVSKINKKSIAFGKLKYDGLLKTVVLKLKLNLKLNLDSKSLAFNIFNF